MSNDNDQNKQKGETDLFREHVGKVKPIVFDGISHIKKMPEPVVKHRPLPGSDKPQHIAIGEHSTDQDMRYLKSGLQQRVLKQLKRGQYPLEAEIDLHNMRSEQAEKALFDFIDECQLRQIRCARIIHGKGLRSESQQPVLKLLTANLLKQHPEILAYISTHQRHGGHGAVLVLIKKT